MSLRRLFYRPIYNSEATTFLNQLKSEHPQMAQGQIQGRARLWDRQLDRDLLAQFQSATLAQQPYVYISDQEGQNRQ